MGKLRIVNGELKLWESVGFPNVDLFLVQMADEGVQVVAGKYRDFNDGLEPEVFGAIDERDLASTKIIGLDGEVRGILEAIEVPPVPSPAP